MAAQSLFVGPSFPQKFDLLESRRAAGMNNGHFKVMDIEIGCSHILVDNALVYSEYCCCFYFRPDSGCHAVRDEVAKHNYNPHRLGNTPGYVQGYIRVKN